MNLSVQPLHPIPIHPRSPMADPPASDGSARMVLETGYHPALLKDQVTTPAGCTVDGILELEEGGLRVTLIKAVKRATQRAKELASSK
jgi:pyrroline-5-carboxylate reductase